MTTNEGIYPRGPMGLIDLSTIWKRKWYLVLSIGITVGLGVAYLSQAKAIYTAEARVLVQLQGVMNTEAPARVDSNFLATQAEIMRSPVTVRKALKSVPMAREGESAPDTVSRVLGSLMVSSVNDTYVLKVGFRGADPKQASKFVNAVIGSFEEYVHETEQHDNSESVRVLVQREKELRDELDSLQNEYETLRKASPLIGQGTETVSVSMAELRSLSSRRAEMRQRRLDLEHKAHTSTGLDNGKPIGKGASEKQNGETNAASPQDDPATQSQPPQRATVPLSDEAARIQQELWAAEAKAVTLSQQYGTLHPQVRALRVQIAEWKQRFQQSQDAASVALMQELQLLKLAETKLQESYDEELRRTKALDQYLLGERHIQDRIGRVEEAYRSTVATLNRAKLTDQAVANGRGSIVVRVLESPELSESQVWPLPTSLLTLCAGIGLIGGCLLIVLLEGPRPASVVQQSVQESIPSGWVGG